MVESKHVIEHKESQHRGVCDGVSVGGVTVLVDEDKQCTMNLLDFWGAQVLNTFITAGEPVGVILRERQRQVNQCHTTWSRPKSLAVGHTDCSLGNFSGA